MGPLQKHHQTQTDLGTKPYHNSYLLSAPSLQLPLERSVIPYCRNGFVPLEVVQLCSPLCKVTAWEGEAVVQEPPPRFLGSVQRIFGAAFAG